MVLPEIIGLSVGGAIAFVGLVIFIIFMMLRKTPDDNRPRGLRCVSAK